MAGRKRDFGWDNLREDLERFKLPIDGHAEDLISKLEKNGNIHSPDIENISRLIHTLVAEDRRGVKEAVDKLTEIRNPWERLPV